MKRPLDGIRVLDLTQGHGAAAGTMQLADFGAEVIKIEKPGVGDISRAWSPRYNGESLYFAMLNRGFGLRTVYCSILYSLVIQAFEWICPLSAPLTDEKMLELFFAVIFPALGSALLFNINASSGGTDIVAMILKKYTGLDVGKALLLSDVVIAASTFLIFNVETGLFSMLGLVLKSVLVDSVIESLNRRKNFFIITSDPHMACDYITLRLHRGATVWEGEGAYTHEKHWVVLTALSRGQAVALRRYLKEHDPQAFFIIANSSEIFGKGFLRA